MTYTITQQWNGGFNADMTIKNNGAPMRGWAVKWAYSGDQHIVN